MTTAKVESSAENGLMRITLRGEIDLANAEAVEDELRAAVSQRLSAVSVDLTELIYIDSAGIRILYQLASRLQTLRIVQNSLYHSTHPLADLSNYRASSRSPHSDPIAADGKHRAAHVLVRGYRPEVPAPRKPMRRFFPRDVRRDHWIRGAEDCAGRPGTHDLGQLGRRVAPRPDA